LAGGKKNNNGFDHNCKEKQKGKGGKRIGKKTGICTLWSRMHHRVMFTKRGRKTAIPGGEGGGVPKDRHCIAPGTGTPPSIRLFSTKFRGGRHKTLFKGRKVVHERQLKLAGEKLQGQGEVMTCPYQ